MKISDNNSILRLLESKLAVVLEIIIEQSYEDGLWISSDETKKAICEKLQISAPTYFRYIKSLTDKSILLVQPGKGIYKLNSQLIRSERNPS